MTKPDFTSLPGIHVDETGPVFQEPWEAQAFSMVIGLYEAGAFEWTEWAEVLARTIDASDSIKPYYQLWLDALEVIVSEKSILNEAEISDRTAAWRSALLATPHGKAVELNNGRK